jgi:hypothetical protein
MLRELCEAWCFLTHWTALAAETMAAMALTTACGPANEPQPGSARSDVELAPRGGGRPGDWDTFVESFISGYFKARPDFAVYQGRHEFDGQLPDWSAEGIAAEIRRLHGQQAKAMAFDAAGLDERQRFEREYLLAQVDKDLFWQESARWPFRNPYWYADALDPNVYVSREYAPLEQRLAAYIAYARAVPRALSQIRANLETPLPRTYVQIGRTTFGGLASYYQKDVPVVFASVQDSRLQAELRDANTGAIQAMQELDAWLAAQEPSSTDDFAMGPTLFAEMLRRTERVEIPLDRLAEIARTDLEQNLAALREACTAFAPGDSIQACVARSQAMKPREEPVAAARSQLEGLRRFLVEKDIVGIPGQEQARIEEAPPYKRWNFAYIDIPGPYEKGLPAIYYIAPPDTAWSEAERRAYLPGETDLLFTTVHEVWPGHFLHFLHSNRSTSKFGRLFVGYAFAEGWAHYAEELMWETGLGNGDPNVHIGQLLNALVRDVRFMCAIGLHVQDMSVEACERLFREQGLQDPGNARQQAARGTFDPAYLNYTLGKLILRKLRDDWTGSRGGRAAWKDFHDRFLSYGGPPIPLVRNAMLGADAGPPL